MNGFCWKLTRKCYLFIFAIALVRILKVWKFRRSPREELSNVRYFCVLRCKERSTYPEICSISVFFRKGSRIRFSITFSAWFFKKDFSHIILIWPNFIFWLPEIPEITWEIWQYLYCICFLYPICDVINFEIYLTFLIKRFFYAQNKKKKNIRTNL